MPEDLTLLENSDGSETPIPVGSPVTAVDDNGDPVTYSVQSPADFAIDSGGQITYTGPGVDRESITNHKITVTVAATSTGADGTATAVTQDLTVDVEDVNEGPGRAVLREDAIGRTGSPLHLKGLEGDPEGVSDLSTATYLWQTSTDSGATWEAAPHSANTGSSYTVSSNDEGNLLRVMVDYTDDAGNSESVASDSVEAYSVPLDRRNRRPLVGTVTVVDGAATEGDSSDPAVIEVRLSTPLLPCRKERYSIGFAIVGANHGASRDYTVKLAPIAGGGIEGVTYEELRNVIVGGEEVWGIAITFEPLENKPSQSGVNVEVTFNHDDDVADETYGNGFHRLGIASSPPADFCSDPPLVWLAQAADDTSTFTVKDDDDPAKAIRFRYASVTATEGDSTAGAIEPDILVGDPSVNGGATVTLVDDSAKYSTDFVYTGASTLAGSGGRRSFDVTWPSGASLYRPLLATVADSRDEPTVKSFTLELSNPVGICCIDRRTMTVKIIDDDPTTVTLTAPDATATEEDASDAATLRLTLGRALVEGEYLEVPLRFIGGANPAFTLSLVGTPAGVSLSGSTVVITGRAGGTATVVDVTAAANRDADTADGTVVAEIPVTSAGAGEFKFNTRVEGAEVLGGGAVGRGADCDATRGSCRVSIAVTDDKVPQAVSLSADKTTLAEGDTLTVTATLLASAAADVTIPIQQQSGAGTANAADFALSNSGGIDIKEGDKTGTLTMTAAADETDEPTETLTLELGTLPQGVAKGTPDHLDITITDTNDDPVVAVLWARADGEVAPLVADFRGRYNLKPQPVSEGTAARFVVTATPAVNHDIEVTVSISESAGSDFVAAADEGDRKVVITAGQTEASFEVATVDDAVHEASGAVTATLSFGTGYRRTTATDVTATAVGTPPNQVVERHGATSTSVPVRDDDFAVVVGLSGDGFATEGDTASTAALILRLSRQPTSGDSFRVPLVLSGTGVEAGDAVVSVDSVAGISIEGGSTLAPVVVFSDTAPSATLLVVSAAQDSDAVHEPLAVSLGDLSGGLASDPLASSAGVRLIDDDASAGAVLTSVETVTVAEGSTAAYTVRLSAAPSGSNTVVVTPASGNAAAATVSPPSITFTASNWNRPQRFDVLGQDDGTDNRGGRRTAAITHAVSSTDPAYSSATAPTVAATVIDSQPTVVSLTYTGPMTVAEGGSTDTRAAEHIAFGGERTGFKITLSRALDAPGERIEVPIRIRGANITPDDLKARLIWSGSTGTEVGLQLFADRRANNAGVTWLHDGRLRSPATSTSTWDWYGESRSDRAFQSAQEASFDIEELEFVAVFDAAEFDSPSTHGAERPRPREGLLILSFADDMVGEGQFETVTVELGDPAAFAARQGTDVAGGAEPHRQNNAASVRITDNDPGVWPSALEVEMSEGTSMVVSPAGGYTLRLSEDPGSGTTVTVSITPSDPSLITVNPAQVSFTGGSSGDWAIFKPVQLTAAADDNADTETVLLTHTVAGWSGVTTAPQVLVRVLDTAAGVTLTESGGTTRVTEVPGAGRTDTYTIVLESRPSADVVITPASSSSAITVSAPVTITPATWNRPVTLSVTAVDNRIDNVAADLAATVTHSVSSTDPRYDASTVVPVEVTIVDDDVAGIEVIETSGSTQVTDDGSTDSYRLRLTSQPIADVSVAVASQTPDVVTVQGPSGLPGATTTLRFTSANWDEAQTVTVAGVADSAANGGSRTVAISHSSSSSSSSSSSYVGLSATVSVVVVDDETPGVAISQSGGSTEVSDDGSTDVYTVKLATDPGAGVTVTITATSATPAAARVSVGRGTPAATATMTFTGGRAGTWRFARTVTVTGVNDDLDNAGVNSRTAVISHSSSATAIANAYHQFSVDSVTVTVNDDDPDVGVVIAETGGATEVSENGGTDTYTVALASKPTGNVNVSFASLDGTVARVSTSGGTPGILRNLSFTTTNWDKAQTVTVTGQNDDLVNASARTTRILHGTTSSADQRYRNLTGSAVEVRVTDDEAYEFRIVETDGYTAVSEGPGTGRYTDRYEVWLGAPPAPGAEVGIDFSIGVSNLKIYAVVEGERVPVNLAHTTTRFGRTSTTWKQPLVFEVEGAYSSFATANSVWPIRHTATVTGEDGDPNWRGKQATLKVTLLKDRPGVTIFGSDDTITLSETGDATTDTIDVVLNQAPDRGVVVTAASFDPSTVKVSTGGGPPGDSVRLTFTTAGWKSAQTVTMHAQNDGVVNAAGGRATAVNYSVAYTDAGSGSYASVTPEPSFTSVAVVDTDVPPTAVFLISTPLLATTVTEGSSLALDLVAQLQGSAVFESAGRVLVNPRRISGPGSVELTHVDPFYLSIPSGARRGPARQVTLRPVSDNIDQADGKATFFVDDLAGSLTPLVAAAADYDLIDDDPTVATLATATSAVSENNGSADVTVTLGSTVGRGMDVVVPLTTSGATEGERFTLDLKSGPGLNTGVTIDREAPHSPQSPALRFTEGAKTATLSLTGVPNAGTEDSTVLIDHARSGRRMSVTGSGGGTRIVGGPLEIKIIDGSNYIVKASSTGGVVEGTWPRVSFSITPKPPGDLPIYVKWSFEGAGVPRDMRRGHDRVELIVRGGLLEQGFRSEGDDKDEPDGLFILEVLDEAAYNVESAGGIRIVSSDDDPTLVKLAGRFLDSGGKSQVVWDEGASAGTREIDLTLGRALVDGEVLEVPLVVQGAVAGSDFSLALKPGTPAGVALAGTTVTFTGSAGNTTTTATLVVTLEQDVDATDELVEISLPAAWPSDTVASPATNVGGGATGEGRLSFHIVDDDKPPVAGVEVSVRRMRLSEGGAAGAYNVKLSADPGAGETVIVSPVSGDTDAVTVSPMRLTFTGGPSGTWAADQKVTVTPVDDDDEGHKLVTVTHEVGGYGAVVEGPAVSVVVIDDEDTTTRGLAVIPDELAAIELFGEQVRRVDLVPLGVSFAGAGGGGGRGTTSGRNAGDVLWTATTGVLTAEGLSHITLTGAPDGLEIVSARLAVHRDEEAGGNGVTGADLIVELSHAGAPITTTTEVTVQVGGPLLSRSAGEAGPSPCDGPDNDDGEACPPVSGTLTISPLGPAVAVWPARVELTEGGAAGSYNVVLTTDPGETATVLVTPFSPDTGAVTTGGATFSFSGGAAGTWNVPQTAAVTPVDDGDALHETVRITHIVQHYPGVTTEPVVTVTVADDEPAIPVTVGRTDSGPIAEGAAVAADRQAEITVTLDRALVAGESFTVPLVISGAGVTADDFTLAAAAGQGVNTGVTLAAEGSLAPTLTFAGDGARTATLVLTVADDTADEPSETLAVGLGTDLPGTLTNAGDTNRDGAIGAAETATSASVVLYDNDGVAAVTLSQVNAITRLLEDPSRDHSGVSDRSVHLEVEMNRALDGIETLEVPLLFAGAAPGDDITLACWGLPCAGFNPLFPGRGVIFDDIGSAKVTFTPTSGQTATLLVRARADSDSTDESATVSIPASSLTGTTRMTATGLGGGATGTGTASFTVIDTDSIETITAKMLGGGSIEGAVSSGPGSFVDAVVELSRPLAAGESVTLAVALSTDTGTVLAGSTGRDFTVSASGNGVVLSMADTAQPTVAFTGSGDIATPVQRAVLRFASTGRDAGDQSGDPTAGGDGDDTDELVVVTLDHAQLIDQASLGLDVAAFDDGDPATSHDATTSVRIADDEASDQTLSWVDSEGTALSAVNVTEGDSAVLAVKLPSGVTGPVLVPLTYFHASTAAADFEPLPASLLVPYGASQAAVSIAAVDDGENEPDETLAVDAGDPPGFTFGAASAVAVIVSDPVVRVSLTWLDDDLSEAAVLEAATAALVHRTAEFSVRLHRRLKAGERVDVPVTVAGQCAVVDGEEDCEGVFPHDYTLSLAAGVDTEVTLEDAGTAAPTVVFMGAGARVGRVVFTAVDDGVDEGDETAIVSLGDAAAFAADDDTNVAAGAVPVSEQSSVAVKIIGSENTPTFSIRALRDAVDVGETASFEVSVSPRQSSDATVTVDVTATTDHVADGDRGSKPVAVTESSGIGTHRVPTMATSSLAQGSVAARLVRGRYALARESATVALRPKLDIGLAQASAGDVREQDGHKDLTVTLARALAGDEAITVPLTVIGVAVGDDFSLALHPAAQTGVSLVTSGAHSAQNPAVRFAAGARVATLRFVPVDNDRRTQPQVVVSIAEGGRAPSASGGIAVGDVDGAAETFRVLDDETGPVVVPADSLLVPSGLSGGDEFRLIFATSEGRDAAASSISVYDDFVRSLAAGGDRLIVPYAGFFEALGSTAAVAARDHTETTFTAGDKGDPIYWLGVGSADRLVASDYEDFYDGSWSNEGVPRTEAGTKVAVSSNGYFTGTESNGAASASAPLGGAGSPGTQVAVGKLDDSAAGVGPLQAGSSTHTKTQSLPMYALSPVLVVETVGARGVTVAESSGSTAVSEAGGVDSYTLVLDARPFWDVVVVVTPSDPSALEVRAGTSGEWGAYAVVRFAPDEWSAPKTVQVRGVDDDVHNAGDERVVVVAHRAESADRNYDKLAGPSVSVSVADDDPERFDAVFGAVPEDLSIAENESGAGTAIAVGSPVTATDADGDSVAYSLEGARSPEWPLGNTPPAPAGFAIDASSGQISYEGTGLDRESFPTVAMVVVATSTGADGEPTEVRQAVSVTVTDVDEGDAAVTVEGAALVRGGRLSLKRLRGDPDGDPASGSALALLWQTSADGVSWSAAAGSPNNERTYRPVAADVGKQVRLQVGYTDGGGTAETVWSAAQGVGSGQALVEATARVTDRVAVEGTANHAEITVRLHTALVAGETVTVPLSFAGGAEGTDFDLSVSGAGASLSDSEVLFTGPASAPAVVSVEALADADAVAEHLTLSVGEIAATGPVAEARLSGAVVGSPLIILAEPEASRTVDISLSTSSALEGDTVTVTVSMPGGPLSRNASLPLSVTGTGVSAADYRLVSPVVIPAGLEKASAGLLVVADGASEAAETWTVGFGTLPAGITAGSTATLTVNDRTATTVVVGVEAVINSASEGDFSRRARLRVSTSRPLAAGEKIVAPLVFTGGSAMTDFTLKRHAMVQGVTVSASGTVTFTGPAAGHIDVNVSAPEDTDAVTERVGVAVGELVATGIAGGAAAGSAASFRLLDNDVAGVLFSGASGLSAAEPSGTARFGVSLASQPTGTVTVTPSTSPGSGLAVSSGALTFDSGNWHTFQRVNLAAVNDHADQPRRTAVVSFAVAAPDDALYRRVQPRGVQVAVIDDDPTAVSLARADSGGIDEAGSTAADRQAVFTVSLGRALANGEVVVAPLLFSGTGITAGDFELSLDTAGGASAGVTLTREPKTLSAGLRFAEGARTARLVVAAAADGVVEPDEQLSVELGGAALFAVSDKLVDGGAEAAAGSVAHTVVIADGDDPNRLTVTLSGGSSTAVAEGDPADTVSLAVALSRALAAGEKLSVPLSFAGGSLGGDFSLALSGTPAGVVLRSHVVEFTGPSAASATLSAAAVDDDDSDSEQITVTIPTADSGFTKQGIADSVSGVVSGTVTIRIADDDAVSVVEGATATYTIRLTQSPAADVTVTPVSDDETVATVSAPVEFNLRNWTQPQTVTVTAPQNNADDPAGSRTATISHTVTTADAADAGVAFADVTVTVVDDDPTLVSVSAAAEAVLETGGSTEITVALGRALVEGERIDVLLSVSGSGITTSDYTLSLKTPTSSVNVGVAAKAGTLATGSPVIEFTEGPGTATLVLAATGDTDDEGDSEVVAIAVGTRAELVALSGTTADGGAAPDPDRATARVEIVDDDGGTARVIVEPAGLSLVEGGDPAAYKVRLATAPTGAVTVAPAAASPLEIRVGVGSWAQTASLSFTASTWWQAQTVDVRVSADTVDQPGTTPRSAAVSHTVAGYTGAPTPPQVAVDIADATPTVVRLSGGGTLREGRSSVTADVYIQLGRSLVAGETAEVPISLWSPTQGALGVARFRIANWRLVSSPGAELRVDQTGDDPDLSGTITRGPYRTNLIVRFTGPSARNATIRFNATSNDRDTADEEIRIAIGSTLNHAARKTNLAGGLALSSTARTADITITDKSNAPALVVSETEVAVGEAGGTAEFTVALGSEPSAAVTVAVASGGAAATVSPASLTFAPGGWSTPQAVTVTGVDDDVDNPGNERGVTVTLDPSSTDAGYAALADSEVAVSVVDDDGAGVTVSQTAVAVREDGGTATYTVVLGSEPTAAVTVSVTSGDTDDATVSPASLSFQPAAWNTPQTVTVTGVDDAVDNPGDERVVTITHEASSSDVAYDGTPVAPVSVSVADDDGAGVEVSRTRVSVAEGGATDSYTVVLGTQPANDVAVTATAGSGVTVNRSGGTAGSSQTLTFPVGDWGTAQTVTVAAVDDAVDQPGGRTAAIAHAVSSSDAGYDGRYAAPVTAAITDDDPTTVAITGGGRLREGDSSVTADVTVTLGRPLVAGEVVDVPITLQSPTGAVLRTLFRSVAWRVVSGATLHRDLVPSIAGLSVAHVIVRFAGAGAQTAVIRFNATTVDSDDDDEDETIVVSLAATANSSARGNRLGGGLASDPEAATATVTVADDDAPASLVVSETGVAVGEAGGTAEFTVALGSEPSAAVTVTVTSGDTLAATVSPASLTFAPAGWNAAQAVTVTGVDDDVDNPGNERGVTVTLDPSSTDAGYAALADSEVAVSVVDDDGAGVTVSQTAVVVSENLGTATYSVVLGSEPTAAVTVAVASGGAAATVSPVSLTFQPAAWNTPQTVTVTGVDDSVDNPGDERVVTVAHAASSSDAAYNGTPVAPVSVTVVDDDGAGVNVSEAHVSVVEGGASDSYTVVLGSQPTHDVAVTVTAGSGVTVNRSGGTAGSSQTLTFTAGDWNTAQTVTVAAVDDGDDQPAGRTASIAHAAASTDPRYNAAPVAPVTAAITDDDPTVVTVVGGGRLREG
ncbi:MAG: hypothetical protein OXT07_13400, partial [bacterium]|nr:hypothetical protein [bacterium]